MKKEKKLLILGIFIIISSFIAYYVFFVSTTTNSNKKLARIKDIDVIFYKVGKIEEFNSFNSSATIYNNGKNLYINVPNLSSLGAYSKIPVVIKNIGDKSARLDSIVEYGFNNQGAINVIYDSYNIFNNSLKPLDESILYITIMWDKKTIKESEQINIQLQLNYVQE